MKLYTEEQVKEAYLEGWNDGQNDNIGYIDRVINSLTPIELPSDNKIEKNAELSYPINKGGSMWMPSRDDVNKGNKQEGFIEGAKWMKEQILNQNK